ncbi:hypothetical protein FI667_g10298, partial [Globisporangium splendens]
MKRDPEAPDAMATAATATGDAGGAAGSMTRPTEAASGCSAETLFEKELCRYPNKRCYSKRALKENGELHKFCEWHRNCANEYQRRLEQRRREKRLNIAPPEKMKPNMCLSGIQSANPVLPSLTATARTRATSTGPPTPLMAGMNIQSAGRGDEYEPFRDPVPLQTEDLHYLSLCFLDEPPAS